MCKIVLNRNGEDLRRKEGQKTVQTKDHETVARSRLPVPSVPKLQSLQHPPNAATCENPRISLGKISDAFDNIFFNVRDHLDSAKVQAQVKGLFREVLLQSNRPKGDKNVNYT